jgi:co-chaperonin GroES (HSP10)
VILGPKKETLIKEGVDMRDSRRVELVEGDLRMTGDRILVRPLDLKLSNVIIANWTGKTVRGEVVSVGPGEYPNRYNSDRSKVWKSKVFRPTEVRPGDIVELGGLDIGGYAFPRIMLNGEEHLIASEKDVCGYTRPGEVAA